MATASEDVSIASVRVSASSSRVRIVAEPRNDVAVDGDAPFSQTGGQATIGPATGRIVVRVPEGVDIVVGTTSARVDVEGRVGNVAAVSESGRVVIDTAQSVDARTTSSQVKVGHVSEECCVRTVSGGVKVGSCGTADVATNSGRISLHDVRGGVKAHCVSGRIEIELATPNDVDAETVSGQIVVSLPPGVEQSDPACAVNARSVSGRVVVSPRQ